MNKQELQLLRQAQMVIRKQDEALTSTGRGLNLSTVPGFAGADFVDYWLQGMIDKSEAHFAVVPVLLPVKLSSQATMGTCDAEWTETGLHNIVSRDNIILAEVHSKPFGEWLVAVINGGNEDALDVLRDFTRTVKKTGGVKVGEDGRPMEPVSTTNDWVDLAKCYLKACEVLGETPLVEPGDPSYSPLGLWVQLTCPAEGCGKYSTRYMLFDEIHKLSQGNPFCFQCDHCGLTAEEVESLWYTCKWCTRFFVGTIGGSPHSEGCGDANCLECLNIHKGECGSCHEPYDQFNPKSLLPVWFDYQNQAWVKDGVYVKCGHRPTDVCGCYGRLHEGETPLAEIVFQYGIEPIDLPEGVERRSIPLSLMDDPNQSYQSEDRLQREQPPVQIHAISDERMNEVLENKRTMIHDDPRSQSYEIPENQINDWNIHNDHQDDHGEEE